jgi:prepilin-type N-terminal cleavage/methylation domain-containing protein
MIRTVGNNRGFSLVEMMIALLIIAISFFALSSAIVSAISVNNGNELRDASVRLTTQTAEVLLSLPFDDIASCGLMKDTEATDYNGAYQYNDGNKCLGPNEGDYKKYPHPVQSVKNVQRNFNISWNVSPLSEDTRQITISVAYRNNGEDHINNAVIYKHKTL